ncbi:hypothetical protein [Polaromonas sp.]|uniref:hypothetical protein n=1 Tax=Polaromonas sp. TaxID=1869339 RepID=UPI0013BB9399|nr:hypothetical protein [Polaromonas sp.]NDP61893.1 hypothetical protein [Polaromonas sp.]
MVISFVSIFILFFVFYKKGVNVFTLTVGGFFFYYYPIIFFNEINWLSDGLYSSKVTEISRYCIFILLIFYAVWALWTPKLKYEYEVDEVFLSKNLKITAKVCFAISSLMAILLLRINANIGAESKVDLMAGVSYELKIFEVSSCIFFITTCVLRKKFYFIFSIFFATLSIWFGFRFLIVELLVIYLILNPISGVKKTFSFLVVIVFLTVFLTLTKLLFYKIPNLDSAVEIIGNQLNGSSGLEGLSIANSESSSVSALFNEIIKNEFHIGLKYFYNIIISMLPAGRLFGTSQLQGFGEMYKSSLGVPGMDSFGSSMYGIGYAMFGYVGLFLFFIVHVFSVTLIYRRIKSKRYFYLKLVLIFWLSISIFYGHRNDIIYNLSLIKVALLVIFACILYSSFSKLYSRKTNRYKS